MLGDLLDVEGGGEEADKGNVLTSGPEDMAGVPFSEGEAWKRGGQDWGGKGLGGLKGHRGEIGRAHV